MLDYIKERIALIVLLVAGDSVSLIAFVKAPEIRTECTSLAVAISLLLMLIISTTIIYLIGSLSGNKKFMGALIGVATLLWIGFIYFMLQFMDINSQYGKIDFPRLSSSAGKADSVIVGGCSYTPEAQREVDHFAKIAHTLTTAQLLADFNDNPALVWDEASRDCARKKIILTFSIMIAFLVAGITLTYEFIALAKSNKPTLPAATNPQA